MYGLSCSPYIATRALSLLAEQNAERFPAAARAILENTYMDNVMSGAATAGEAVQLLQQLQQLLELGCFPLHKFASNSSEVLADIQESAREKHLSLSDGTSAVSALGLKWDNDDYFRFAVSPRDIKILTKRSLLAEIARISYDPLGLIAPVTVLAKIIMQSAWKLELGWDESPPSDQKRNFNELVEQLHLLKDLKIPRAVVPERHTVLQLCAFIDASERAYGACVYLRAESNNSQTFAHLLSAKSRIAPIRSQTQSLARLELSAALMTVELVQRLRRIITLPLRGARFWTDSEIVLHWIAGDAGTWPTFVRNRVAKIQRQSTTDQWSFLAGTENPADIVSRGMMPIQLLKERKWFHGPEFLILPQGQWPKFTHAKGNAGITPVAALGSAENFPDLAREMSNISIKENSVHHAVSLNANQNNAVSFDSCDKRNTDDRAKPTTDWVKSSKFCNSFGKLSRTTAWMLRFIRNSKAKYYRRANKTDVELLEKSIQIGPLHPGELEDALKCNVRCVQSFAFAPELSHMYRKGECPSNSRIRSLFPFLDETGLLRIGGRLRNANLKGDRAHPMLLPSNHPLTLAIAAHYHRLYLHAGPKNLLAHLRHRFWPLQGGRMCRRIVNRCYECFRAGPKMNEQVMGDLPVARVQPSRPFLVAGVDFAGPFLISPGGRGRSMIKAYVCLFTCFSTSAVHLKLTSELSTDKILEAIGLPREIVSDNMKGFIGAAIQLESVQEQLENGEGALYRWSFEHKVRWRFIPARWPHHRGAWERLVGLMKKHLARVISLSHLTREEAETLLFRIEGIMNSRPLMALTDDPDDLDTLTPAHFLVGQPLTAMPEEEIDVEDRKLSLLRWYHRVVALKRSFWVKWHLEYLQELHRAAK